MIYTVTCNPALDYVLEADKLTLGKTNRARHETIFFGGKGLNVSLVLRELGVESVALGFVAGFTGEALERYIREAGICHRFIHLPDGLTRINVKVRGMSTPETEINARGPEVPAACFARLLEQLGTLGEGDTFVLSGSLCPGMPEDAYAIMMKAVSGRGVRVVVDTTGASLRRVLPLHPYLVKPNRDEAEALTGQRLTADDGSSDPEAVAVAATWFRERGAQNVLISLGRDGAYLLDDHGNGYHAPAVGGAPLNTVGAGDSMVAGFLAGEPEGALSALRLAIAAGGATATSLGLGRRDEILRLYHT